MKKTYSVEVDCANCAAKMEAAAGKVEGITRASISYVTQKMTLETDRDSLDDLLPAVVKACKRVDGDFAVL